MRGLDIPWVGVLKKNIGRGFYTPWVRGSIYQRRGVNI